MPKPTAVVGDHVTIVDTIAPSQFRHLGATGVVSQIFMSVLRDGEYCYTVKSDDDNLTTLGAYAVEVINPNDFRFDTETGVDLDAFLTTDQLRRSTALFTARTVLPDDLLTEDYIAAAQWIADGALTFNAEPTITETEATVPQPPADDAPSVRQPDFDERTTTPDYDRDALSYFYGTGRSVVFSVAKHDEDGKPHERRAVLVNSVKDIRDLRDFLTRVLDWS